MFQQGIGEKLFRFFRIINKGREAIIRGSQTVQEFLFAFRKGRQAALHQPPFIQQNVLIFFQKDFPLMEKNNVIRTFIQIRSDMGGKEDTLAPPCP